MGVKFSNNAESKLTAAITAGATSFDIDDVSELPDVSGVQDYMYLTISDASAINIEIIKVTSVSGNTLTVERGQDGTAAVAFALGDEIGLRLTTAMLQDALADNIAQINWKQKGLVATTANITLSGEQTIDGIATSGSRVLVKDQTAPAENGVYLSASGAWSRTDDADIWDEYPSLAIAVEQGTVGKDTIYVCSSDSGGTLETTAITFVEFGSGGGGGASAATQAEQETGTDVTVFVSPGRQHFHESAAKVWVLFNGTATISITRSYGVSSLTDNGTGNYAINFTTAFSSVEVCAIGVPGNTSVPSLTTFPNTASQVRLFTLSASGTLTDSTDIGVVVFGDV